MYRWYATDNKAREYRLANLKHYSEVANLPPRQKGKTRDIIAPRIKMAGRPYDKAKQVVAKADELQAQGQAMEAYGLLYVLNKCRIFLGT